MCTIPPRPTATRLDVAIFLALCACGAALIMAAVWIVEAAIAAFVGAP